MIKEVFMIPPTHADDALPTAKLAAGKPEMDKIAGEWEKLRDAAQELFGKHQVNLLEADPNLPELCFGGEGVFLYRGNAVFGNHLMNRRAKETNVLKELLRPFELSYHQIAEGIPYEGSGDTLAVKDSIIVGTGQRSANSVPQQLFDVLKPERVTPVHLTQDSFFHLDMIALPINKDQLMICKNLTDNKSISQLSLSGISKAFVNKDVMIEGAGQALVHNDKVLVHAGTKVSKAVFEKIGLDVIEVEMYNLLRLGGSVKRLTIPHYQ